MDGRAKLFEECSRGRIHNRVDGVESKRVDVEFRNPLQSILDEISPNFVAASTVEIDSLSPGRLVEVREIRTEIRKVISLRAKMVVNYIEDNSHSLLMARIDECLQP